MAGMDIAHTGLGLARGDLGKRFRGARLDSTPRFLAERSDAQQESMA
jgi:hypothetical protein